MHESLRKDYNFPLRIRNVQRRDSFAIRNAATAPRSPAAAAAAAAAAADDDEMMTGQG
jgi:hypothetical protein